MELGQPEIRWWRLYLPLSVCTIQHVNIPCNFVETKNALPKVSGEDITIPEMGEPFV
jgi:hypothetical protein